MPIEPSHDCPLCPRLMAFRHENRRKFPGWFNGPVPCFGPMTARIAIAGLAPGLQGANRTGRPFTGDWAGDLLYDTLLKLGLARGVYEERADDTLEVAPLLPAGTWDWFCLDGVRYHGREVTIFWDKDGSRYGRGAGFAVLVDGKLLARSERLGRLIARLP